MSPIEPLGVWMAIAGALLCSAIMGVALTARTLRWVYLHPLGLTEREEQRTLAIGHLVRESTRLIAALLALGAGNETSGRAITWTPVVWFLVWLLGTLLSNSLTDHVVRFRVTRLARVRLTARGEESE
jgi:hypothetical protein